MNIGNHNHLFVLSGDGYTKALDAPCHKCNVKLKLGDSVFSKRTSRNGGRSYYHQKCAEQVLLI